MTEIPYGYCQCGCGGKTAIATRNEYRRGHIKGNPLKFLPSHNNKGPSEYCKKGHRRTPNNIYAHGGCKLCAQEKRATRDKVKIYAILDPESLLFRYVGQTSKDIELRMGWHRKPDSPTKHLARDDKSFVVVILETVMKSDADDAEKFWIKRLRFKGFDLLNVSDGGAGTTGRKWTDSQRKKFKEATNGSKH